MVVGLVGSHLSSRYHMQGKFKLLSLVKLQKPLVLPGKSSASVHAPRDKDSRAVTMKICTCISKLSSHSKTSGVLLLLHWLHIARDAETRCWTIILMQEHPIVLMQERTYDGISANCLCIICTWRDIPDKGADQSKVLQAEDLYAYLLDAKFVQNIDVKGSSQLLQRWKRLYIPLLRGTEPYAAAVQACQSSWEGL